MRLARPVARMVVAWGLILAPPAMAQDTHGLYEEILDLHNRGDDAQAIPLAQRLLTIVEKTAGPDDHNLALMLNMLGGLYHAEGRYAEAEPLLKRALAIDEKRGPDHQIVGVELNNLARVYQDQGRYAEAEPLLKRALAIDEKKLGPDDPHVATKLNNLAGLYQDQGRYAEAELLNKRALAIDEKVLGPDDPAVALVLIKLADQYRTQGRYAEAEPFYKRSLAIWEKADHHPFVAWALNGLARLYFNQSDWTRAALFWERSTGVIIPRAERSTETIGTAPTGKGESEAEQNSDQFWGLVKAAHRLAAEPGLAAEMFETAQWARSSEAAASLAQMAARSAAGKPALAAIVRERQDLVAEWQKREAARSTSVSQHPEEGSKQADAANGIPRAVAQAERHPLACLGLPDRECLDNSARVIAQPIRAQPDEVARPQHRVDADGARLEAIDTRITEIDKRLAKDFRDYAALASPKPLSIPDVQSQLRDNEALVLFLDTPQLEPTPEETFIWVVTKTDSRWVKSEFGTKALEERVTALRCGLDSSNWTDASAWSDTTEEAKRGKEVQIARRERCKSLTGREITDSEPLPFDIAKANELYRALFGQVEDLLKNPDGTFRQLLVVPSGPLTQLPFQVLVTGKPEDAEKAAYANAAWLIRRHAIAVLPSVASLKELRQHARTSRATKPLIGFGNPLLDGNPEKPWQVDAAHRAREKEHCPKAMQQVASVLGPGGGVAPLDQQKGVSDVALIRFQAPLPETADELCAVADDLGVRSDEIRLGSRATEREVKALSSSGSLATYRIVQFSTHGALAGQMRGNAEPGLILTPPETATPEDDGYLSASEIAGLKLDADWVILSACNTAAGGAEEAEALSGLARAFFYAGARALLVSHWSVYSDATVKLITKAVSTMATDASVGRSEALRRSMVAMIEGQPQEAHPAYWAPFVVVGEGGAPSKVAAETILRPHSDDTSAVVRVISTPATPPTAVEPAKPAPAGKKMKRKPGSGDNWITNIFGQ